jgi:hypothetical protein
MALGVGKLRVQIPTQKGKQRFPVFVSAERCTEKTPRNFVVFSLKSKRNLDISVAIILFL